MCVCVCEQLTLHSPRRNLFFSLLHGFRITLLIPVWRHALVIYIIWLLLRMPNAVLVFNIFCMLTSHIYLCCHECGEHSILYSACYVVIIVNLLDNYVFILPWFKKKKGFFPSPILNSIRMHWWDSNTMQKGWGGQINVLYFECPGSADGDGSIASPGSQKLTRSLVHSALHCFCIAQKGRG